MSLILDALNRADRERSEQQLSPSLHAAPSGPDHSHFRLWRLVAAIVALALLAGVAIAFWLLPQRTPQASPAVTSPAPALPLAAPVPAPPPEPAPPPAAARETEPAPKPAPIAAAAPQASAAPRPDTPPGTSRDAIAELYARPATPPAPAVASSAPAPPPPPEPPPIRQPRPTQAMILHSIPLLATMPASFQRQVPSIEYSIHVYNDEDGSGAVKLNGSMLRVGAELTPGLRVIAILPDSTVFDFNGTQFRLNALNSWMNFQ